MSTTSELKRCPKCGGPIPAEAPQGLCPPCLLLQASIPTETGKHAFSKSPSPTQTELAAAFPQLEILELIGQGGMGFVFKARQPKLERLVALKILPQSLAADPAFAERFAREGRTLARLNHPNIVTIHDFGQANGFFYLLMEFVDGVNLRQAMKVGRFTPEQALAVVPKICDALQFAHNEGILHRDIKPENILLDAKGRVKIADFGIAKIVGAESEVSFHRNQEVERQIALTGVMGTPQYMAPEQLEHPQEVDQRADIYSLGVVFYEMLTGELPVGRFAAPSEKSSADPRLDEVVLRALEKEPNRRTQSAGEVKTQVETIATSAPVSPQGITGQLHHRDRVPAKLHFRRGALIGLMVFTLILAGAIALAFVLPRTYLGLARVEVASSPMGQNYDPYRLQSELERIKSTAFLREVVKSLSLSDRTLFTRPPAPVPNDNEVMLWLRGSLDLRTSGKTSLLEIYFYSDSPLEAAEIANKIAETYCSPPGNLGQIIDRAIPATRPIRPNRPLIIFLGFVVGTVAGILIYFIVGLFPFSLRNQRAGNETATAHLENQSSRVIRPTRPWALIIVASIFMLKGCATLSDIAHGLKGQNYIDPGIFALPIGIGLLRFRRGWRFAALAGLWLCFARWISAFLPILAGYYDPVLVRVWNGQVYYGQTAALIYIFYAVLLIWMYRVLVRSDIKGLFKRGPFLKPWLEFSVLFLAFAVVLLAVRRNAPSATPDNRSVALTNSFVARLSQGTIELVAVTGCSNYSVSWKPDGNPTERLHYDNSFDSSRDPEPDPRYMCRKVVFKTSGMPPGASPLCIGECAPVTGWSFLGDYINGEREEGMTIYGLGLPIGADTIPRMKVGVATEPWTDSRSEEVPRNGIYNGSAFNHEGISWKFHIQDIQEINGATRIIAYHTDKPDWQSELVLVDSDGKEWLPVGRSDSSDEIRHLSGTCNVAFSKIKTFHLRVRRYQWIEFRNISLQPDQRTDVEIVDEIGTKKITPSLVSSAKSEGVSAIGSFHLISAGSHLNLVMARAESVTGYPIHQIVARFAGPSLQLDQWDRAHVASLSTLAPALGEKLQTGWRPEPVESKSIWNGTPGSTVQHSSEIFECPNECQLQFALADDEEAKEAVRQLNIALAKPMDLFPGKKIKLFQVGEREAWLEIREFQAAPGRLGFIGVWDRSAGKSPVYLKATEKDPFPPAVHSAVISIPSQAELDLKITLSESPSPLFSTILESKADQPGVYWLTWYAIDASDEPAPKGPCWEIFIHDAQTARELRHLACPRKSETEWQSCHYETDATNEAPGITFERLLFYAPDPAGTEPNRNKDVHATMTMRPKSNEVLNNRRFH